MIADYYRSRRGRSTTFIPYGADEPYAPPGPVMAELGLEQRGYILYVGRLEPENNALVVIEAHARSGLSVPLVIVGDAPYASDYKATLREAAGANVLFPGYVFGDGYVELQSNALLVVQATEVGGTHPALIEAMSRGATVVANDVPEHREVLADAGVYYRRNDVSSLASLLGHAARGQCCPRAIPARLLENARESSTPGTM